jgi:hypothetical protein
VSFFSLAAATCFSRTSVRAAITLNRSRSFVLVRGSILLRSAFHPERGHSCFAETGHYRFAATPLNLDIDKNTFCQYLVSLTVVGRHCC